MHAGFVFALLLLGAACKTPEPATQQGSTSAPAAADFRVEGFLTPESVLWDEQRDEYLVSNIAGQPLDKDKNGCISRLSPDGKIVALKFIDGSQPATELNAPKGMALVGGTLFVTDIDVIRSFDRATGAAKGAVEVAGATFLNDLAATADGKLWVSESAEGGGAVYLVDGKQVTEVAKGPALGRPNGLLADKDGVWVVTLGDKKLYHLTRDGKRDRETNLPAGGLDGLVDLGDGTFLVSSWEAKAVYRGKPGGSFEPVISGVTSPADIGWDAKRRRVLIPLFQENAVVARLLK